MLEKSGLAELQQWYLPDNPNTIRGELSKRSEHYIKEEIDTYRKHLSEVVVYPLEPLDGGYTIEVLNLWEEQLTRLFTQGKRLFEKYTQYMETNQRALGWRYLVKAIEAVEELLYVREGIFRNREVTAQQVFKAYENDEDKVKP